MLAVISLDEVYQRYTMFSVVFSYFLTPLQIRMSTFMTGEIAYVTNEVYRYINTFRFGIDLTTRRQRQLVKTRKINCSHTIVHQ